MLRTEVVLKSLLSGQETSFSYSENTTVYDVKKHLQIEHGYDPMTLTISWNGEEMSDSVLLRDMDLTVTKMFLYGPAIMRTGAFHQSSGKLCKK